MARSFLESFGIAQPEAKQKPQPVHVRFQHRQKRLAQRRTVAIQFQRILGQMLEGFQFAHRHLLRLIAQSGVERMTGFPLTEARNVGGHEAQRPRSGRRVLLAPVQAESAQQSSGGTRRFLVQGQPELAR